MQDKKIEGFGRHLILSCYGCTAEKLSDQQFIYALLANFPQQMGVIRTSPPYVFSCADGDAGSSGMSGVAIASNAHLTIHTFPEDGHAFADVFLSHNLEMSFIIKYLLEKFSPASHDIQIFGKENNANIFSYNDLQYLGNTISSAAY